MCCFQHLTPICFSTMSFTVTSSLVKNEPHFPWLRKFWHCHTTTVKIPGSELVSCELTWVRICNDETCGMLQFKKAEWAKTVISYSTDKAMRLPVVDVAVRDVGAEDQSFWLEIGLVCYT